MTKDERQTILSNAIETYGGDLQMIVAIEEMSELQKVLCKYLRGKHGTETTDGIREEIADVQIMLDQLKLLFDTEKPNLPNIEWYEIYKLKRLYESMRKG